MTWCTLWQFHPKCLHLQTKTLQRFHWSGHYFSGSFPHNAIGPWTCLCQWWTNRKVDNVSLWIDHWLRHARCKSRCWLHIQMRTHTVSDEKKYTKHAHSQKQHLYAQTPQRSLKQQTAKVTHLACWDPFSDTLPVEVEDWRAHQLRPSPIHVKWPFFGGLVLFIEQHSLTREIIKLLDKSGRDISSCIIPLSPKCRSLFFSLFSKLWGRQILRLVVVLDGTTCAHKWIHCSHWQCPPEKYARWEVGMSAYFRMVVSWRYGGPLDFIRWPRPAGRPCPCHLPPPSSSWLKRNNNTNDNMIAELKLLTGHHKFVSGGPQKSVWFSNMKFGRHWNALGGTKKSLKKPCLKR